MIKSTLKKDNPLFSFHILLPCWIALLLLAPLYGSGYQARNPKPWTISLFQKTLFNKQKLSDIFDEKNQTFTDALKNLDINALDATFQYINYHPSLKPAHKKKFKKYFLNQLIQENENEIAKIFAHMQQRHHILLHQLSFDLAYIYNHKPILDYIKNNTKFKPTLSTFHTQLIGKRATIEIFQEYKAQYNTNIKPTLATLHLILKRKVSNETTANQLYQLFFHIIKEYTIQPTLDTLHKALEERKKWNQVGDHYRNLYDKIINNLLEDPHIKPNPKTLSLALQCTDEQGEERTTIFPFYEEIKKIIAPDITTLHTALQQVIKECWRENPSDWIPYQKVINEILKNPNIKPNEETLSLALQCLKKEIDNVTLPYYDQLIAKGVKPTTATLNTAVAERLKLHTYDSLNKIPQEAKLYDKIINDLLEKKNIKPDADTLSLSLSYDYEELYKNAYELDFANYNYKEVMEKGPITLYNKLIRKGAKPNLQTLHRLLKKGLKTEYNAIINNNEYKKIFTIPKQETLFLLAQQKQLDTVYTKYTFSGLKNHILNNAIKNAQWELYLDLTNSEIDISNLNLSPTIEVLNTFISQKIYYDDIQQNRTSMRIQGTAQYRYVNNYDTIKQHLIRLVKEKTITPTHETLQLCLQVNHIKLAHAIKEQFTIDPDTFQVLVDELDFYIFQNESNQDTTQQNKNKEQLISTLLEKYSIQKNLNLKKIAYGKLKNLYQKHKKYFQPTNQNQFSAWIKTIPTLKKPKKSNKQTHSSTTHPPKSNPNTFSLLSLIKNHPIVTTLLIITFLTTLVILFIKYLPIKKKKQLKKSKKKKKPRLPAKKRTATTQLAQKKSFKKRQKKEQINEKPTPLLQTS